MNRSARMVVATLGLKLTAAYWFAGVIFTINITHIVGCGIVDYSDPNVGPSAIEINLRFFGALALVTVIYGVGIHLWQRLDQRISR
jgi:hypothetical protein